MLAARRVEHGLGVVSETYRTGRAGLCIRFGVYAAGVASTEDPKYVVLPQRARRGVHATGTTRYAG